MNTTDKILLDLDSVNTINDWENPPTVKNLQSDYELAKDSHSLHVKDVNKSLDIIRATPKLKPRYGRSVVNPKLVRTNNEWRISALEEPFLSGEDMFRAQPRTFADTLSARQNQQVLNKQFSVDIDRVALVSKTVNNVVNRGTAVLKTGWETEYGIARVEEIVPVYAQSQEEALAFISASIDNGTMDINQAESMYRNPAQVQTGTTTQVVEKEVKLVNRPSVIVVDSRDVIVDPTCNGVVEDAKFMIHEFYSDIATLKADGRYKNIDYLEATVSYENEKLISDEHISQSFKFDDKPRKKLVVREYWGYWDINGDNNVVPIVATYVNNVIIQLEENPYPDKKFPFVFITYIPHLENSIYGESDSLLLEDIQKINGSLMRASIDIIGVSANGQRAVAKGFLDPANKVKLNNGDNFEYNPIMNPKDGISVLTAPEVPASLGNLMQMNKIDAEALSGSKSFHSGISGDSLGSSVGGIKTALDATAKREASILRRIAQGFIKVARKIAKLNSVYLSDEEIIRISDEEFVTIKRDDLQGDYDLILSVSTAEENEQKATSLSFMFQTTAQGFPIDFQTMILAEIARLRKLPELAKKFEEYKPAPDPQQQKLMELEILLKEEQIKNVQADTIAKNVQARENTADIYLKNAKTKTENAKAGKLQSEADIKDLDFLDRSSNRKQELDLEKIDFQAKLNLESELIKQDNANNYPQQSKGE